MKSLFHFRRPFYFSLMHCLLSLHFFVWIPLSEAWFANITCLSIPEEKSKFNLPNMDSQYSQQYRRGHFLLGILEILQKKYIDVGYMCLHLVSLDFQFSYQHYVTFVTIALQYILRPCSIMTPILCLFSGWWLWLFRNCCCCYTDVRNNFSIALNHVTGIIT